jgi:hypothetical protein
MNKDNMNRLVGINKSLLCEVASRLTGVDASDIDTALWSIEAHFEGNHFGSDELESKVKDERAFSVAQEIWDTMEAEVDREIAAEERQSEFEKSLVEDDFQIEEILSVQEDDGRWIEF